VSEGIPAYDGDFSGALHGGRNWPGIARIGGPGWAGIVARHQNASPASPESGYGERPIGE